MAAAHASVTPSLGRGRSGRRDLLVLRSNKDLHGRATPERRPRNPAVPGRGKLRKQPSRRPACQARRLWRQPSPATSRRLFVSLRKILLWTSLRRSGGVPPFPASWADPFFRFFLM